MTDDDVTEPTPERPAVVRGSMIDSLTPPSRSQRAIDCVARMVEDLLSRFERKRGPDGP